MNIINSEAIAYPSFGCDATLLVVLTQDKAGLYAVYAGIVPANYGCWHKSRVAGSGAKLSYAKARQFFHIEEKEYRA